ncbi:MAG TPA: DUF4331 domain-containing protein [Acidimicrobiales bacterium]|nr:DUF4331 domain-containing protein [Acidimicrobiales bacterium]
MSSHREAPQISKDPVADSADLYAFVSPDKPSTVTLIANYVPLQGPDGGPNFYEFGEDVLYEIHIDNTGDAKPDISFQFRFKSDITNPNTFLYNTGPIQSLTDKNWNRRQLYSLTRLDHATKKSTVLGRGLSCPPCNIGPLSTPDYASLASAAVNSLSGGVTVFAGQRADGFYVDLGATFELAVLRPFEADHATFGLSNTGLGKMAAGINATKSLNVHTLALQVPMTQLTRGGSSPTDAASASSVIGIWTTASRQKARVLHTNPAQDVSTGPYVQISRLGNPLVNEVLVPLAKKDYWNGQPPSGDKQFAAGVSNPELSQLLPVLYPGVFPNLAAYNAGSPNRADLEAVFLTGIPTGVVTGFQNFTTHTQSDMLRLNMAIAPASKPSNLGLVGGDPAGWPNGRRVFDDVVTIELRALAGATLPLVDPSYKADAAAGEISPGLTSGPTDLTAMGTENYMSSFPYLGEPYSGFAVPAS